jgi:hypothetical protein
METTMTDTEAPEEEQEYVVTFMGSAATYVTVTATNASDAVHLAEQKLPMHLCFHCAHPGQTGFNRPGDVQREWPEAMEVDEVTADGAIVDSDEY